MNRTVLAILSIFALAPLSVAASDPAALAAKIDTRINDKLKAEGVLPAPRASDAEFLRRATLDILGRIPTVAEARAFIDDKSTEKRSKLIDQLLAEPSAVNHAASVWRLTLVPQSAVNPRVQFLNVSLEAWLRDRLRSGRKADGLVRDLLTAPLDYLDRDTDGKPRPLGGASALAFYQANDLKPETVTASAARIILGIRIECAQCHNHPFDKWTQKQFWETAAFFAPVAPQGLEDERQPAADLRLRKTLVVNETEAIAIPKFLDGSSPDWEGITDTRQRFADWATSNENPYFAKTTANRVWAQFFGVGLVDPVDDFNPSNTPSHPELLNDLAAALIAADFDTDQLARAIGRTDAYQRTSRGTEKKQNDSRLFARMNVKGLTPEQLFDSLAQATGFREEIPVSARAAFGVTAESPRGQFLAKFAGGGQRTDAQTSILQALTLMNGPWLAKQTDPEKGELLAGVAQAPFLHNAAKLEVLFLAAYSRKPTADETGKLLKYLSRDGDEGRNARLADVLWSLLNSQEFLLNH